MTFNIINVIINYKINLGGIKMFWLGILFTIIFMGLISMFIVMMKELPNLSIDIQATPSKVVVNGLKIIFLWWLMYFIILWEEGI